MVCLEATLLGVSYDAVFHVGGFVNGHNCHHWLDEEPFY